MGNQTAGAAKPASEPGTIALVAGTRQVKAKELARVAAALRKQIRRDFAPVWHINVDVQAVDAAKGAPSDAWTVTVVDRIKGAEGAISIHSVDKSGRPFVEVTYGPEWTIGASHDLMEMLVDPRLNRVKDAPALGDRTRQVTYSVQICDPCAAKTYTIDGIKVADFTTPDYWQAKPGSHQRYSHTGAVTRPRQILRGGYLSWLDRRTNRWVQRNWFGKRPTDVDLGSDAELASEGSDATMAAATEVHIRFHVRMLQEAYRDLEPRLRSIRESIETLIVRFATPAS